MDDFTQLPKRILVTGGAGFIGSHTVDLLLAQDREVVVLDDLSSGNLENLPLSHPNLEFIEGNILEFPLVKELIANCDAVLHLAAIVSVPFSVEQPIFTLQVNTQGCLHVLQAVRECQKKIRVVFASSAAVYGNPVVLPCRDDEMLTQPIISPYGLQKRHAEQYGEFFTDVLNVPNLALRYFNVYGIRQDPKSPYSGVISLFMKAYQQDETLTIYGDGEQTRDFIHVSDVARANMLALCHPVTGVMNIATGHSVTLRHLVDTIAEIGGRAIKTIYAEARLGDVRHSAASVDRAEAMIKFRAEKTLLEGLRLFTHPHP